MKEEKLESKVVVLPDKRQFLVKQVQEDETPSIGFGADVQRKDPSNEKRTCTLSDIQDPYIRDIFKTQLGIEPEGNYQDTNIGFRAKTKKKQPQYQITEIKNIIV